MKTNKNSLFTLNEILPFNYFKFWKTIYTIKASKIFLRIMSLIFPINYKKYHYLFEFFKWFSATLIAPLRNEYLKTNLQAHFGCKKN